MLTKDFYELIDHELLGIIEKYKDDTFLKKQKGEQGANNKKSYAFLIWFLEFYARRTEYLPYITDSNSLVNRQSETTNNKNNSINNIMVTIPQAVLDKLKAAIAINFNFTQSIIVKIY